MMKVGFIGLGYLGKTIAKRLVSEGVDLIVWNRTREKCSDLGVDIATTPAELIAKANIAFLNLFDSYAVESVVFGKDGFVEESLHGKIIIDTTTNHFQKVTEFHEKLSERGATYLEAPVLGSVVPASQGNLTVLVSGDRASFDSTKWLIEKIGKTIFYLEEPSIATKMKLINNLLLGVFMATIAEASVFAEHSGVEKETALNVFAAGAGNSMVLNAKREKIMKEDFSTHFSSALIHKDLHYLQDLAKTLRRPLFTGSVVKELFGLTFTQSMETLDFSAVYKVLKNL
jgi:3-hydroxyisobutyrate dehydrogenase